MADLCHFKGFRQLSAGASRSREMVPELKLMFLNPWLSPGKPGAQWGQIWQCSQLSRLNPALVLKFNSKHLSEKENNLGWATCPVLQFNKDCLSESFTFPCSCSPRLYLAHALDLLSVYMSVLFFSSSSCSSLAFNTSPCPVFSPSHPHPPTSPPDLWHYRTAASNCIKPLASNQGRPKCRKVRIN